MSPQTERPATGWWLLLAVAAALAALQLWLRPLLPVDETRYLSVAWEMWTRQEWLVPFLNGEPYSHKPPLLFWLIQGLWSLTGVSGSAARLLAPLMAVAGLWLSAVLARRLWPGQTLVAVLVPWLLFGSLFWLNFHTLVQFDMLLLLAALLAWLGVLEARQRPLRGWSLVAAAIGFGVLAKGPVILVPVLPAVLFAPGWMAAAPPAGWGRWYLGALLALLGGAALALAWALPAGAAGGEAYRQAILWGQSAGRLVDSFAHRSPWWSYLLWLPLMWLPWVLWPRLWRGARIAGADTGVRFCLAVLLPALLVFTLISGKQGKYLLPLLPLLALLSARWLASVDEDGQRYPLHFAAAMLALAGLVLLLLPWLPQAPPWLQRIQLLWGAALLVWAALFFRLQLPLVATVRAAALAMALGTATVYLGVVSEVAPRYDLRAISATLSDLQQAGRPLAWLGSYHGEFHFLGRLRGRIEALENAGQLRAWLRRHPDGYLLVNDRRGGEPPPPGVQVQPYRSGQLQLWPAALLLQRPRRLDALAGNA